MTEFGKSDHGDYPPISFVDLALGQGLPRELQQLREMVGTDPAAAIEFAETRDLIERFRGLECEPSEGFPMRMARACEGMQRRRHPSRPLLPRHWPWAAAAAALVFAVLAIADPLGLRRAAQPTSQEGVASKPIDAPPQPFQSPAMPSTLAKAIEATQRLAPGTPLADAWTRFSEAPSDEQLAEWVAPANAVSFLRLERELRETAELRRQVLRDAGLATAIRARAESMASSVAADAVAPDVSLRDLAMALRALVGAGSGFDAQAQQVSNRLCAGLSRLEGGDLAMALCALGEAAAATGSVDEASLQVHGSRLVAAVLEVGEDSWSRRRPRMLQGAEPAANLAAAGRFLRMAPAFGVDSTQARAVRLLLLAHLEERRASRVETPDLPTAMAYGFQDLMGEERLGEIERSLRRWRPEALAPDYLSLQMFAATRRPGLLGFARWQLEVRKVAVLPEPRTISDRSALSRCLSDCLAATALRQELAGL